MKRRRKMAIKRYNRKLSKNQKRRNRKIQTYSVARGGIRL